jgi:hypothetical protein
MTASRYATALAALGRSAASLAPILGCHPRTCQGWLQDGPPPEILTWVERMARAVSSVPVPEIAITAGRPRVGARKPAHGV